nr:hypothetical protein W03G1.9 - Caenorhabditis elegans [Caenorhabditis elegans]
MPNNIPLAANLWHTNWQTIVVSMAKYSSPLCVRCIGCRKIIATHLMFVLNVFFQTVRFLTIEYNTLIGTKGVKARVPFVPLSRFLSVFTGTERPAVPFFVFTGTKIQSNFACSDPYNVSMQIIQTKLRCKKYMLYVTYGRVPEPKNKFALFKLPFLAKKKIIEKMDVQQQVNLKFVSSNSRAITNYLTNQPNYILSMNFSHDLVVLAVSHSNERGTNRLLMQLAVHAEENKKSEFWLPVPKNFQAKCCDLASAEVRRPNFADYNYRQELPTIQR